MDAKTLEKMTVSKLREEALKFDDLVGVHGMHKEELLPILKQKYGIAEEKTQSEALIEKKHALKASIKQLKAEKAKLPGPEHQTQAAVLRQRLRRKRRLLKKIIKKVKA